MLNHLTRGAVVLLLAWLPLTAATAQEPEIIMSYEKPGVDYSPYKRFMVKSLDFSNATLIPPPWVEGRAGKPRPWKVSDKNAAFFQEQYHAAMRESIGANGGYALATEPGEDVLVVAIELISLTPYAQPKQQVITKGAGEMTIRAEIRDSMSNEVLVLFEGDTMVGEDYQENTDFNIDQNVDALFRSWGEYLRDALTEVKMTAAE